jgi:hypothetical protein
MFVRDEDWPFRNLPSPGDAVLISHPDSGGLDVEQLPSGVVEYSPRPHVSLGARQVERVVYVPTTGEALVDFHVRGAQGWACGVDDQVQVLLSAGFHEVPQRPNPEPAR